MIELERVFALLDKLSVYLDGIEVDDADGEGPVQAYADIIVPRLRSTYKAMVLLLKEGHLEEAVVLLRRQLEDSVRLGWLSRQTENREGLILGFGLARSKKVLGAMDRLIQDPDIPEAEREIIKTAKKPRARVHQKQLQTVRSHGIEPGRVPMDFDVLAKESKRWRDIVVYASASEVAHSAISAITQGYSRENDDGKVVVSDTSHAPSETATYARSAVGSTVTAIVIALSLRGRDDKAKHLTAIGMEVESEIVQIRTELLSG